MQGERGSRSAWWIGCLVAALAVFEAGTAVAESLIETVSPASRKVTLTWMRAPEDSFHTVPLDPAVADSFGVGVAHNVPDYRSGRCNPGEGNVVFGGYKVWRKAAFDHDFVLLRKYCVCDTLYNWTFKDLSRRFVDPDSIFPRVGRTGEHDSDPTLPVPGPFDGFDYQYSVTVFDLTLVGSVLYEVDRTTPEEVVWPDMVEPNSLADEKLPFLDQVRVVPNPYQEGQAIWSVEPKIQFQNLPQKATLRIFTTAGDLVRTIEHNGGRDRFGTVDWDLKNGDGRDVVPGIYLYHVTTPNGEEASGQFVIIR